MQNVLFTRYWLLGDHLIERIRKFCPILCAQWKPDVIVRGEIEFSGCVAAERLGIPHASIKARPYRDAREIPGRPLVLAELLGKAAPAGGISPPAGPLPMPYRLPGNLALSDRASASRPYPSATCRPGAPDRLRPVWIRRAS